MSARFLRSFSGGSRRVAIAVAFAAAFLLASAATASTADLVVSNSDSPDPVTAGSNITYTQSVKNNGPDAASSLVFVTSIPAYTTFNSTSISVPAGWTCITPADGGTGAITCTMSSLSSGTTKSLSFSVKVSSSAPAGYFVTNTATALSSTPDSDPSNNSVTVSTAVTTSAVADVATTVSMPSQVTAGGNFTITQVVTNNGGGSATNLAMTMAIPANTTFQSMSIPPAGWTCITGAAGSTYSPTCSTSGSLSSGSSATFNVTVKVDSSATAGTSIPETVSITPVNDPNATNNTATATATVVASSSTDFAVTTSMLPARVADSGTLQFTNVVTNNGPSSGSVTFTESIPSNTTFSSLSVPAGWTCTTPSSGGTGSISCSPSSSLSSGGSATFTGALTVGSSVTSGTAITLSGTVTASSTDSVSTNNTASATSLVETSTAADVGITISDSPDPVVVNQNFTYLITVTNYGPATATNVAISDVLPSGVSYSSADWDSSNVSCSYSSGSTTLGCSITSLAVGASEAIVMHVKGTSSGTKTNSVSITSSDQTDPYSSNDSASTTTTIDPDVDLTITKSNNVSGNAVAGNSWTWTIHVANGGSAAATFAQNQTIVLDNLPSSGMTYGSVTVANASSITGTISASISNDLTATASGGSVTIGAGGSFDLQFTATASTAGSKANPRSNGIAAVDPDGDIRESSETNNTATDTVTVVALAPDLTLSASNNVSSATVLPTGWTWTLHVANGGTAAASFSSGQTILLDNLPGSGLTYGTPSIANSTGITGTVSCGISSNDLTCTASGAVSMATSASFDVQFTATPSAAGTFANPRSGGTAKVDPNSVVSELSETNNTATDSVTVTAPDLTTSLTDNAGGAMTLGNNWTWTLTVANSGTAAASFSSGQTIVSDSLPNTSVTYGTPALSGISGISGTVACSISSSTLTCTASGAVTMASSSSFSVTFTATPSATGTFANPRSGGSASVDPAGVVSESNEANNSFSDTVTVTAPDLTATIANNVAGATTLGNNWTWTVTLANSGSAGATFATGQTIFKDNLPNANISYGAIVTGTSTNVVNAGNISCAIASGDLTCVAIGGSVTIGSATGSYSFTLTATPSATGTFANPRGGGSASIDPSSLITESNEGNNSASDIVTVTAPDLTATLANNTAGATTLGNGWTWSVTVANGGNAPATFAAGQTILSANLPNAGIAYSAVAIGTTTNVTNSGNIACAISGGDLVCTASGAAVTFGAATGSCSFSFTATPSAVGAFAVPRAGGSASADPSNVVVESSETNNGVSDTVTVTAPDLTLTAADDTAGAAILGGSWTWALHLANGGNAPASFAAGQSIVSCDLPNASYGSVTVANASGIGGSISCGIASSTLSCTASGAVTITAGGSADVKFTATPTATGTFALPRSGGSASADPTNVVVESNESNNGATDTVVVTGPDLAATSTNSVGGATLFGGSWTWTIHVTNSGLAANFANGQAIVRDNLPNANVTYGTASIANATGITGTISCAIDGSSDLTCLASGAVTLATSSSFDATFTAIPSAIGTFANPRAGGAAAVDPDGVVTESNEANNSFSDSVVVTAPDLTAAISDNVAGATTLGNTFTWSLAVANSGNGAATFASGDVILSDALPNGGIAYGAPAIAAQSGISGTGSIVCSIASSDLTCVASGGTIVIVAGGAFRIDLTATPAVTGTFSNPRSGGSAAADPANAITESNESNNSASGSVTVTAPQLTLTLSDGIAGATTLGQSWSWTLHVANSGSAPASFANGQTIVLDNLPNASIAYGAVSVANSVSVSGTISAVIANSNLTATANGPIVIAAGGSFDLICTATPSAIGVFANPRSGGTAAVDPANVIVESNEGDNSASDSVTVSAPDLTLSISNDVSGSIVLGNSWTWTLHVANGGNAATQFAAAQTIVSDALPPASYGAASIANASSLTGSVACSIDGADNLACVASGAVTLGAGGSFDVRVAVTPAAGGTFTNPRAGGSASADPLNNIVESSETNNAAAADTVTVRAGADLSLALSGPATAVAGDPAGLDYTLTVTNNGPQANSGGFAITDALPAGLTYSAAGSTSGCSASGQTVTCSSTSGLAVGGSQALTLHVIAASSSTGSVANSASVASSGTPDPNAGNDISSIITTALQSFTDYSVSTSAAATIVAGAQLTCTVTVTNGGPSDDHSGFTLTDTIPAGTAFVAAASDAACAGGAVVTCAAGGLTAGASRSFTIVVATSTSSSGTTLQNRAAVASNGGTDPSSANDTATTSTSVGAQADLALTLGGPSVAGGGSSVTYTLNVTNAGPSDAQGVTVTAVLPPGMTLFSQSPAGGVVFTLSNSGNTMTATASSLPAGASSTILLFALAPNSGATFTTSAAVSSTTADPASANNTASIATNVVVTAPAIGGVSPFSGPTAGGQAVTITGANLDGATAVSFGGAAATISSKASTAITVTTPPHAAGAVDVVVTTAGGSATASGAYTYTSAPAIAAVSPSSGPETGGTAITISGSGFAAGATVSIGSVAAAVTSLSSTAIVVMAPAHAPQSVDVVVRNPDGQSAAAAGAYTYIAGPRIASVSPVAGWAGGGTAVTIRGSGFMSGASVAFGATAAASVSFVSATTLVAITPAHATGSVDLTVRNADGQSAIDSAAYTFTLTGDVNGDGRLNAADIFYLLNYLFANGSAPVGNADVNGDGKVSAADAFYLVNYLFAGGPPPR